MWLKLTTDSGIASQPTGFVNMETGVTASVVSVSGGSYYAIGIGASGPLDGDHYATADAAQVALQQLVAGVDLTAIVG